MNVMGLNMVEQFNVTKYKMVQKLMAHFEN